MLALTICYSANIGGTGTVIGTAPNVIFMEYLEVFPDQPVTFSTYMIYCVPHVVVCLFCLWAWLQIYFLGLPKKSERKSRNSEAVAKMIKGLSNLRKPQKI